MTADIASATPWGIDAHPVQIEVRILSGPTGFKISGLSKAAVRETTNRVRAALRNSGFELPPSRLDIQIEPADFPKQTGLLDLPIALAILVALGEIPHQALDGRIVCGELRLDGTLFPICATLAIAELASRREAAELLVPAANVPEAELLEAVPVTGVRSLSQAVGHLRNESKIAAEPSRSVKGRSPVPAPDLSEVRGCHAAKRALEVAAAGGHPLLLVGPPGSGKTMLARRLGSLLPPLERETSIEVTKIQSMVAIEPLTSLACNRPFRCPHPSVSYAAMTGGGSVPRPGELSLAHGGVLFLDELPEFSRDVLEAVSGALHRESTGVVRHGYRAVFPARCHLVAAMTPCPCGHHGDPRCECRCPERYVDRFRLRVPRPLLSLFDLKLEVLPSILGEHPGEPTETIAEVACRVLGAQRRHQERVGKATSDPSELEPQELIGRAALNSEGRRLLEVAFRRLSFSPQASLRTLRVAQTIADLDQKAEIQASHVAESLQYQTALRRSKVSDLEGSEEGK